MLTQRLLQAQEFLIRFDFANPWVDPWWSIQDAYLLATWAAEDYLFISPLFWAAYRASQVVIPPYVVYRFQGAFNNFLRLGRGRQDPGYIGFLTHAFLEFVIMRILRFDVLEEPFIHPFQTPYIGRLAKLPERMGPRPRMLGVDPLKQDTGNNGRAMYNILRIFQSMSRARPDVFQTGWSDSTGLRCLKIRLPNLARNQGFNTEREWDDEIAHVRSCGALVIHLHPGDAAEVIQSGWGQRHPLCAVYETTTWRLFYHMILRTSTPVSPETVIVYAPLNHEQFRVVVSIISAAVWWAPEWEVPEWDPAEYPM